MAEVDPTRRLVGKENFLLFSEILNFQQGFHPIIQDATLDLPAKNFTILESVLIPVRCILPFSIPCVFSIAMIQDCEHLLGPMTYNEWTPDPTKAS